MSSDASDTRALSHSEDVFFSNDNLFIHNRVGGKEKRKKGHNFFLVQIDKLNTKIQMLNKTSAKYAFIVVSLPTYTSSPLSTKGIEGIL